MPKGYYADYSFTRNLKRKEQEHEGLVVSMLRTNNTLERKMQYIVNMRTDTGLQPNNHHVSSLVTQ
jgi:hypothetical protein